MHTFSSSVPIIEYELILSKYIPVIVVKSVKLLCTSFIKIDVEKRIKYFFGLQYYE